MKTEIYALSTFGYEEYDVSFVKGPKVDDWEKYVSQFEKEALQKASRALKRRNIKFGSKWKLTWNYVIPFLIKILAKNGYEVVSIPEKSYSVNYHITSKGEKL